MKKESITTNLAVLFMGTFVLIISLFLIDITVTWQVVLYGVCWAIYLAYIVWIYKSVRKFKGFDFKITLSGDKKVKFKDGTLVEVIIDGEVHYPTKFIDLTFSNHNYLGATYQEKFERMVTQVVRKTAALYAYSVKEGSSTFDQGVVDNLDKFIEMSGIQGSIIDVVRIAK